MMEVVEVDSEKVRADAVKRRISYFSIQLTADRGLATISD